MTGMMNACIFCATASGWNSAFLFSGQGEFTPMKPSIVAKLEALYERHEEVQALLGDAATIADQDRFRALSREYAQLSDVARCYTEWRQVQDDIETAQMMLDDAEMREMAQEELRDAKAKSEEMEQQLQVLLLPKDPDDERNAFVEVRAGTGGDEAALFAGDLFRMYSRYAESRRWRVEIMSANEGEHGGYKEVIAKISGDGVYGRLKFESGGHRVQRVPATESGPYSHLRLYRGGDAGAAGSRNAGY